MKKSSAILLISLILTSCQSRGISSSVSTSSNTTTTKTNELPAIVESNLVDYEEAIENINKESLKNHTINLRLFTCLEENDISLSLIIENFNAYQNKIKVEYTNMKENEFPDNLSELYELCFDEQPLIMIDYSKIASYALEDQIWALDGFIGENKIGVDFDFSEVYENIDKATKWGGNRYAIPVDSYGTVTAFRQDIIKKNELGFDNNTRFIPESREEYQTLLEGLRAKTDAGELWIRNIEEGHSHKWTKAKKNNVTTWLVENNETDELTALYTNGGSLMSSDQSQIKYHLNDGLQTYFSDLGARNDNKLVKEDIIDWKITEGNIPIFTCSSGRLGPSLENSFNNTDLKRANNLGVTAEEAQDPVYNTPLVVSRPLNWWTLEENMNSENADKWAAKGHAFAIPRTLHTKEYIYSSLTFIKWFTQEQSYGHMPKENMTKWGDLGYNSAWKNIYRSESYQKEIAESAVLKGLGDPNDVIPCERLAYSKKVSSYFNTATDDIKKEVYKGNYTKEEISEILNNSYESLKEELLTIIKEK